MNRLFAALLGLTVFAAGSAQARCNTQPGSCEIEDGVYEIALPGVGINRPPVVMFLHGAGGTGATTMGNRRLVNALLGRGYAVLAPTGARRFGNGRGRVWNFYPGWQGRDETDFLERVMADAAGRFNLDASRVLLAGFSAGAFMVSYLACDAPGLFAAYAPVSGGFWRPHPESCTGPVKLFQTHGWSDRTVPIEGRYLRGKRFQQGDIFTGLEIWRAANRCQGENPDSFRQTGQFWRRKWANCAPDSALEMAMFPGGHTLPNGWSTMVLDWFEAVTTN